MTAKFDKDPGKVLKDALKKRLDPKKLRKADLEAAARRCVDAMKAMIAKGVSPISGSRFPAYKNPDRYPGDLKAHTPVNLKLTGKFLDDLRGEVVTSPELGVRFWFRTKKSELKERGHREGERGQPKRPILPEGNERFAQSLRAAFSKEFKRLLEKLS